MVVGALKTRQQDRTMGELQSEGGWEAASLAWVTQLSAGQPTRDLKGEERRAAGEPAKGARGKGQAA